MARKNYDISEKSIGIIRQVMADENLKSETAAIEFIIHEYSKEKNLASEISGYVSADAQRELKEIKGKLSVLAYSSDILLDAINSMLIERGYTVCYSAVNKPSSVLIEAKENWKKAAAYGKQIKDDMNKKNTY